MIPHFRPDITEDDINAVVCAMRKGHLSGGAEVARLEQCLSARYDGAHVVAVSSGTAALHLALVALELERGAEVIIPSYTCNSLYVAAAHAGLCSVCADSAGGSPSLGADTVSTVMSDVTGAIVVPHTFGYLADMAAIGAPGVPTIEDCAHVLGVRRPGGTPVGLSGRVGVFSFYATKLLPSGEGGACITRDAGVATLLRRLRDCDEQTPDPRAFNFKMNDLCAALAANRIDRLDDSLQRRADIARRYDDVLGEWSYGRVAAAKPAVHYRYLLHLPGRVEEVIELASARGVTCRRPVFRPLHELLGGSCPRAGKLYDGLVSIPLYPGLDDKRVERVAVTLRSVLTGNARTDDRLSRRKKLGIAFDPSTAGDVIVD